VIDRSILLAAMAAAAAAAPSSATAAVERFAVLIGHNEGARGDAPLRYAEDDAGKVQDVLRDLGGFDPDHMVLLLGEDATTVRRALIAMNDRLRARLPQAHQALLFVYYSGHADAESLHLGGTMLALSELEQLVRGSSAEMRLLVVDACRSGALTRVKGGQRTVAFKMQLDQRLAGEGAVFLTSSSANEDSQESDELRGSFFTHYLVSGLLGPADVSGDGQVSLEEAYRYAYSHTLAASSRTLAGPQHPTFRYDLRGRGDFPLTMLVPGRRATMRFPGGRAYLVFRDHPGGSVVAEVGAYDRHRAVMVRPGHYFVRGRGPDHLLEGHVTVATAQSVTVEDHDLERIEYARLVRKGGGELPRVHGLEGGYRFRTSLYGGGNLCHGPFAAYRLELQRLTLASRLGGCRGSFVNDHLRATTDEVDLELRLSHAFDMPLVTVDVALAAGAALLAQRFETRGSADDRTTAAGHLDAAFGAIVPIARGIHASVDVAAQTYLFRQAGRDGTGASIEPAFSLRTAVLVGAFW
jgi:hypothetical protein